MATTADGWPYVLPTDTPISYPTVSQDLANKLQSKMIRYQAMRVLMPAPASVPNGGSLAITFQAGLFTATPAVVASPEASGSGPGFNMITSPGPTGATIIWWQLSGAPISRNANVIAAAIGFSPAMAVADIGEPTKEITVTCHTGGCLNEGIPIGLAVPVDVTASACGVCGQRA